VPVKFITGNKNKLKEVQAVLPKIKMRRQTVEKLKNHLVR